jgi:hypothetical protein
MRCGKDSSIPIRIIDEHRSKLLADVSLTDKAIELINAYIRRTYYLRIDSLKRKREQADVELKKVYELRQTLIEKNLSGIYSDDVFKEQNKLLEEKIKAIQAAKNDAVIEKYNLEAITTFTREKFRDLNKT